jgi:hypothetical protein
VPSPGEHAAHLLCVGRQCGSVLVQAAAEPHGARCGSDQLSDSRARKLVVLAGSRRALAAAVRTPGAGRRHTALTHRLQTIS